MKTERIIMKGWLNKRIIQMNQYLDKINKELEDVPKGSLRILKRQSGKAYYFHKYTNAETGKCINEYIEKKNEGVAFQLAQKGYNMKVKRLIEKELRDLNKIKAIKVEEEIDKVYDSMSQERKMLVTPIRVSVKEKIRRWQNEEYLPSGKYTEKLIYETARSEMVRSKSEVIIANMLYQQEDFILYKYERPLEVIINGSKCFIYPDFTILNLQTGKITYWEHAGRMDDARYANDFVNKVNTYIENGLIPGKDVIFTYETMNTPLNIHDVKILIQNLINTFML